VTKMAQALAQILEKALENEEVSSYLLWQLYGDCLSPINGTPLLGPVNWHNLRLKATT